MIRNHRQILALASPPRLAVLGMLEANGPSSVAALAGMVGARPDALYHHLRILETRGLIRRAAGQHAVYEIAAPLVLDYRPGEPRNRAAVIRVAGAILRGALRAFTAAFARRPRVAGKRRELWAAQEVARLSGAELERVNALLRELLGVFESARGKQSGERLYSVTFVLTPQEK